MSVISSRDLTTCANGFSARSFWISSLRRNWAMQRRRITKFSLSSSKDNSNSKDLLRISILRWLQWNHLIGSSDSNITSSYVTMTWRTLPPARTMPSTRRCLTTRALCRWSSTTTTTSAAASTIARRHRWKVLKWPPSRRRSPISPRCHPNRPSITNPFCLPDRIPTKNL